MKCLKHTAALLLAAALLLSCAACGGEGEARAASMWLVKTEGTVSVTDGEGGDVSLLDRLGLFSGYGVATQAASFGWIDLGDTKLTKMDENSGVTVQKDGKHLELTVDRGALFFNVTRPLGDDESFEIRSSTMVTAIRGTCGWVEVPDEDHMNVYILEGTVECSVGEVTESVTAGQTAAIDAGTGAISVKDFTENDIPAFVAAEVEEDPDLADAIQDASGLDMESGLRRPDLNAYGATVFEQRENYIDFDQLPPVYQAIIQDAFEHLADVETHNLTEMCSTLDRTWNFFTTWNDYKVYFSSELGFDGQESSRLVVEFRPENGMGYVLAPVRTPGGNIGSNYSCPCEGWQWNGDMTGRDDETIRENGRPAAETHLGTEGQLVDGLRQGAFRTVGLSVKDAGDGSFDQERIDTENVFTDGRGVDYRDGMTDQASGVYLWGIVLNLGEAPAGGPLTQYQLDMLYW